MAIVGFGQIMANNTLFTDGFEGYFDQHKQREKISSTPFARAPQLDSSEYVQLAVNSQAVGGLADLRQRRLDSHTKHFNQWAFELEQGYSVLLFGAGSKIALVDEFVGWWEPEVPVIGINGYNPATTFKDVLNACISATVKAEIADKWFRQPSERLVAFLEHLETHNLHFALVVHSIDGSALRDTRTQSFMARLAGSPQVTLLASCDHVNAPLLWSDELCARYAFVWHHTPTYAPYSTETAYQDVFALGQSRATVGIGAARTVLASLTANAQKLYQLLTTQQYERMLEVGGAGKAVDPNQMATAQHGIEMGEFFTLCVRKFVVSSEVNFKVMLSEFKEHKMAEVSRSKQGQEVVFVPYTFDDLEQLISEY